MQRSMNAKQFSELLIELGACGEACYWAAGKSLATVWQTCRRGDWLLWLLAEQIGKPGWPTHKQLVLAGCDCAETALTRVPAGEDRPRIAIQTARKWARGKSTLVEVEAAANAAYAAAAAASAAADSAAASAAAYAASAAASAAAAAAAAASAAYAAADSAADSAAASAADSAYAYAYAASLKVSAQLVRKRITCPGKRGR